MGKPTEQGLWSDAVASFGLGMNSDVPPVLLPKDQLAFATNCTVRGEFVTHRPPRNDFELSQAISGLFQGASYYKPDSGSESIVVSVSGSLYKITPASSGTTAEVSDISIQDDPNSATNPQAWMWQGENYLFVNNGEEPTEIFDGNSTRRADTGTLVGTTATNSTISAIGTPFQVELVGAYTGPLGVTLDVFPPSSNVRAMQAQVSVVSSGGYNAVLTNLNAVAGQTIPSGTNILQNNQFNGSFTESKLCPPGGTVTIGCTPFYSPGPNTTIRWGLSGNFTFLVTAVTATAITIRDTSGVVSQKSLVSGDPFNLVNPQPDTIVGVTNAPFVVPSPGSTVNVDLVSPYNGTDGKYVTVNGESYTIAKGAGVITNNIYLTPTNMAGDKVGSTLQAGATLKTLAEIPVGTVGAYGMGRNWIAMPNRKNYLASDLVGSSSGTLANNFRDAILNVTENYYLAGGGLFYVPGAGQQINAMGFPATLDSSLGQGALQVLTQSTVFSCNAPVDRLTWQDLVNPIQTQSLVGAGALGDVVAVNGDLWFRAVDGIRSLRLARQEFSVSYSNTPQSIEMNRVLMDDNRSLLGRWNGVVFDNRLLSTADPLLTQSGVVHNQIIALNLDPNSGLLQKRPPVYDGAWSGVRVFKLVSGTFNGVERLFAVTLTDDDQIGLSEILATQTGNNFDNGDEKITWSFETPALFYQPDTRKRELLRMTDGEIFIKDISGDVEFAVYYRPDYLQDWTLWHYWKVTDSPNFQPRMGLGTPPTTGDDSTQRPNCVGYHFQLKVVVRGSCVFMGANLFAATQPQSAMAKPIPTEDGLTPLSP